MPRPASRRRISCKRVTRIRPASLLDAAAAERPGTLIGNLGHPSSSRRMRELRPTRRALLGWTRDGRDASCCLRFRNRRWKRAWTGRLTIGRLERESRAPRCGRGSADERQRLVRRLTRRRPRLRLRDGRRVLEAGRLTTDSGPARRRSESEATYLAADVSTVSIDRVAVPAPNARLSRSTSWGRGLACR